MIWSGLYGFKTVNYLPVLKNSNSLTSTASTGNSEHSAHSHKVTTGQGEEATGPRKQCKCWPVCHGCHNSCLSFHRSLLHSIMSPARFLLCMIKRKKKKNRWWEMVPNLNPPLKVNHCIWSLSFGWTITSPENHGPIHYYPHHAQHRRVRGLSYQ